MGTSPPNLDAPWTIARLLTWTTEFLTRQGVDDPRLATEVLLAHAVGWRRIDLYARFEKSLRKTCALCARMHQRDVDRWRDERDRREEWIKTYLHGKPEKIDDTWAKMVY